MKNRLDALMDRYLISAGQLAFVEDAGGTAAFLNRLHSIHRYLTSHRGRTLLGQEVVRIQDALHLFRCSVNTLEFTVSDSFLPIDHELPLGELFYWVMESLEEYLESGGREPVLSLDFTQDSAERLFARIELTEKNSAVSAPHPEKKERRI